MKNYAYLMAAFVMVTLFTACNKGPQYLYVETLGDEAKVSYIESEDDNDAYSKAFENYSNARFYPIFSEFEKTHRYIKENDGAESCEGDEGDVIVTDNSEGGAIIYTGNDVNDEEGMGTEPTYEELLKINAPSFILYKLEDSAVRDAAKDLIDKKISYDEFMKKTEGKIKEVNLYDKNFDACVSIDRKVFDNLLKKLRSTIAQIDKDAEARKAEAAAEADK